MTHSYLYHGLVASKSPRTIKVSLMGHESITIVSCTTVRSMLPPRQIHSSLSEHLGPEKEHSVYGMSHDTLVDRFLSNRRDQSIGDGRSH